MSKRNMSPSHWEMNLEPCMSMHGCTAVTLVSQDTGNGSCHCRRNSGAGDICWHPPHADKSRLELQGCRAAAGMCRGMSLTFTLARSDAAVSKPSHSSEMPDLFHVFRHPAHEGIGRYGRRISLSPLDCTGMSLERASTFLCPFPPSRLH